MHWVIGDIHGMHRPLLRLLDVVRAQDTQAHFVFAGDYVNRGPDSRKVIDLCVELSRTKEASFIRGNHDDVLDLIVHGHSYAETASGSPAVAFQWFMDYGLDSTFYSYGADWAWLEQTARHPTPERLSRLAQFIPREHREFLRTLPAVFEHDTFFVVHGQWKVNEPCYPPSIAENLKTDPELRQSVLWGRYTNEELASPKEKWGRRGFVGHTPVHLYHDTKQPEAMKPIITPNLVLLDTACALINAGRLTAFCVEEDRYVQVDRAGVFVE